MWDTLTEMLALPIFKQQADLLQKLLLTSTQASEASSDESATPPETPAPQDDPPQLQPQVDGPLPMDDPLDIQGKKKSARDSKFHKFLGEKHKLKDLSISFDLRFYWSF